MTFGVDIVCGTFQRIDLLKAMMQSVRRFMHFDVPYRFVICDGGSTDGTLEWLRAQPDVTLLADGELTGAISAFTRAAYQATYDYTILVNDDVLFVDYSILAALAYLEEHPSCGAVAFADDRPAQSKPAGFAVQTMTALTVDGRQVSIPYAQVGLYRRWLGDLCGWWGAYDPLFKSHTYGGDNYLTARIIEYGYSVDAVQGVRVKDIIAQDGLREHNTRLDSGPSGYYARFTSPPQMREKPRVSNPQAEGRMRLLYLPIFESGVYPHHRAMKRGLREALQTKGHVIEVDYLNEDYDLVELVKAWQPHILFTQCQRDLIDLRGARQAQPDMLVLNWNGDVYLDALISSDTLVWLKMNVDAQLCVNGAALPVYQEHQIPAAYWQCAYEPVNGNVYVSPENAPDIVLMGSAYSDKRHELAQMLIALPYTVHLVGTGWVNYPEHNAGNTTYQFEVSHAIRQAAKLEIGDNQYEKDTGFVSNRIFDCLAAGGALLLHQRVERLEDFTGLQENVHYVVWDDFKDLEKKIAYYLNPRHEKKRAKIVKQAYDYVRAHHSFAARLDQLFNEILSRIL